MFPSDDHDHALCVAAALARAEVICRRDGVRLTTTRRQVLGILWQSHQPLGAYDILDDLKALNTRASAPTVYRTLDFLLDRGLIHRLETINAYIGCIHPDDGVSGDTTAAPVGRAGSGHGPFLLCRGCGVVSELNDGDLDVSVARDAHLAGFSVEQRTLELVGLCTRCRQEAGDTSDFPRNMPLDGLAPTSGSVPGPISAGETAVMDAVLKLPKKSPEKRPEKSPVPLMEATGIHLSLGGVKILDGVGFSVNEGEILTLIGPNGAGKTSLVRVVLGLLEAQRGRVFRRKKLTIGYMPQRLSISPDLPLSVSRFLTLAGPVNPDTIMDTLDEVGAAHLADHPFQGLSGGETSRVLLARALVRDPDLLVLDEPVQGVDIIGQSELYQLISKVRSRHKCGVLMVSHDLHVVMAETDRVICLNHHVCCTGHPEAVSRHPEYLALFGSQGGEGVAVYTHHHDHRHDVGGTPDHGHDHGHDHGDHP